MSVFSFHGFPKIDAYTPTAADIKRAEPYGWLTLAGISLLFVGLSSVMGSEPGASEWWYALAFFGLLSAVLCFAIFASASEEFAEVSGDSNSWSCRETLEFFQRYPEFSAYREEVLKQGRPLYAGEMNQLRGKAAKNVRQASCLALYSGAPKQGHPW